MSAPDAIVLDRVSKRYRVFHRRAGGLKDRLIGALTGARETREDFWALRAISLAVARGETLGIIGPNGGGKSTLLQIIAGILTPDEGRCHVLGRVTSLLELGAGFSPDLSGRENIFLNASLHGVPRGVVSRRFADIVAYAELERFIDMPVRNYSSGMYVRLGFAVAVHLNPEVILVDEAFAVGDEAFQRKCLTTIRDFQRRGVTIVMVSHDLLLVERFSSRVAFVAAGEVVSEGPPAEVIARYHASAADADAGHGGRRWGTREVELTRVELLMAGGPVQQPIRTHDAVTVRLHYVCRHEVERPVFGIALHRDDGMVLSGPNTRMSGLDITRLSDRGFVDYTIPRLPLLPGRYFVSAAVYDYELVTPFDHRDRVLPLLVVEGGTEERFGYFELGGAWSVSAVKPGGVTHAP